MVSACFNGLIGKYRQQISQVQQAEKGRTAWAIILLVICSNILQSVKNTITLQMDNKLPPFLRPLLLLAGLLLLWQGIVTIAALPHYILPSPLLVIKAIFAHASTLWQHLKTTSLEIFLGLILGTLFGCSTAVIMTLSARLRYWLLPILVVSQAIPVFALAPILVLWLGYGIASKIAMAVLVIFFPVTSTFYQGMRSADYERVELARLMGGTPLAILRFVIIPSALPAFGGGMRVAAAVAPIGAVIGEWVGASSGLGYYMLHTNARMQVDRMFAALFLLAFFSVGLYYAVDFFLKKLIYWEKPSEV